MNVSGHLTSLLPLVLFTGPVELDWTPREAVSVKRLQEPPTSLKELGVCLSSGKGHEKTTTGIRT